MRCPRRRERGHQTQLSSLQTGVIDLVMPTLVIEAVQGFTKSYLNIKDRAVQSNYPNAPDPDFQSAYQPEKFPQLPEHFEYLLKQA